MHWRRLLFCAWHAKNPISIGWESLFKDPMESTSHDVDKSAKIDDEMCILDEDIKQLDSIEHEFTQKQELAAESKQETVESRPGQSSGK